MKLRVTYSALFSVILFAFLLTTATGIGPYSTKFGAHWFLVLLICAGLMIALRPKELAVATLRRWPLLGFCFFFLLFVAALATHEGRQLTLALPMIVQLLCYLLALWLASRFIGTPQFSHAVVAAFIVAAGINLYEFFLAPQAFSISEGRAAGFFVNPNTAGAEIALLAALVLSSDMQMGWLRLSSVLLAAFLAILVTFSRGALVIFVLLVAIYFLMRARERRHISFSVLIALAASVPTSLWVLDMLLRMPLSKDAGMRLDSMLMQDFSDASVGSRTDSLFDYLRLFLERPLAGFKPFGSLAEMDGRGPHNSFIALGADFGLLAMLAPLAIIAISILTAKAVGFRGSKSMILLAAGVWMFAASMVSHNVFYSPYGAIAAGIAMGGLATRVGSHPLRRNAAGG